MPESILARALFFGAKPCISRRMLSYRACRLPYSNPPCHRLPAPLYSLFSTRSTGKVDDSLAPPPINATSAEGGDSSSELLRPSASLNPPSTARPPPFEPPVYQPKFTYYLALGKATLKFYKTGIKGIYTNYRLSREIYARLNRSTPLTQSLKEGLISRGEYHLLERTKNDLRRALPFALVFLVCGEFTPLVVVALSDIVPRTLWIPKQVLKARKKLEARRKDARKMWGTVPANLDHGPALQPSETEGILKVGRMLGLYPEWWDRLPWKRVKAVRQRLTTRLQELEADDIAIERDGGVEGLEGEEVKMAAERRGLDVLEKEEEELRGHLKGWLQAKTKRSALNIIDEGLSPLTKN